MADFNQLMQTTWLGNLGVQYLIALGVFVGSWIVLWIFRVYIIKVLKKLAKRSKMSMDDYIVEGFDTIHSPFYIIISVFTASKFLVLPEIASKVIFYILLIGIVYYAVVFAQKLVDRFTKLQVEKRKAKKAEDVSMISNLGKIAKAVLWIIAILVLLANFGINITPLIAGLGIGGIAIAFALQNILEDLFSSFSIYFDEPFKVGDYIVVGGDMGVVEHIGIKTTRIRTLQGQELVVSNRELTSARINNYKKMEKRRIAFAFGVEYGTSIKKLKKINSIVKQIIDKVKLVELDRVHFKEFGASSLNYEVVYYVGTRDYTRYMDIQQEINLAMAEAFEKQKIEFAFPTQTIHVKK